MKSAGRAGRPWAGDSSMNTRAAPTTSCSLICLGLIPYGEALLLQRRLAALRVEGRIGDLLLLLQHPPVITLGRGGQKGHLLADDSSLAALGIEFFEVERGGDITYHGPGQLVGYPILNLAERGRDIHHYLRRLEDVVIETLTSFEIASRRFTGRTGVWVGEKKIASIGIHVGHWVTRHGFALNVHMDLAPFECIVPCGIHGATVTSMANELSRSVEVTEVVPVIIERFEAIFGVSLLPTSLSSLSTSIGVMDDDLPMASPPREVAPSPLLAGSCQF